MKSTVSTANLTSVGEGGSGSVVQLQQRMRQMQGEINYLTKSGELKDVFLEEINKIIESLVEENRQYRGVMEEVVQFVGGMGAGERGR